MGERDSKTTFTVDEMKRIITLVTELEKADSSKQKGIRGKIRKIGLYWSEVAPGMPYTVSNLKRLVENGTLRISDSGKTMATPIESSNKKESLIVNTDDSCCVGNDNEISKYMNEGFEGFIPVKDLRHNTITIPNTGGVYVLLRMSESSPHFLETGSAGFFKGKDPNVSIEELAANYINDSKIVYIGKATSLRKRLGQLLHFGAGSAVGHWGGRYLWQLADAEDLLVAWKVITSESPRDVESRMLIDFKNRYGKLPFANLSN